MNDSFATRDILEVNGKRYQIRSLAKLGHRFDLKRLPYSMKILLENLLRHEDGTNITAKEIEAVANWIAAKEPDTEIRILVLLPGITGERVAGEKIVELRDRVVGVRIRHVRRLQVVRQARQSGALRREIEQSDLVPVA